MKEITVEASVANMDAVIGFLEELLDECGCPVKAKMQMEIAVDEIFSNIARYAYTDRSGEVTIRAALQEDPAAVCLTFLDRGIPYNPLEKEDPDITLSAEEREIGGLGIYMVKKHMDDVCYRYCDGQNQLTIKKYI